VHSFSSGIDPGVVIAVPSPRRRFIHTSPKVFAYPHAIPQKFR
jgi:hypothetical protein